MKTNKLFLASISLMLVISIVLTGCTVKDKGVGVGDTNDTDKTQDEEGTPPFEKFQVTNINVPFNPTIFETKVKPYSVNTDLSNVVNAEQFGEFSKEQLELLTANKFVVNPTKEEQLFHIYEYNQYDELPSFITTDSVLQVYHIFYDYYLRTLENEKLLYILEQLTDEMLVKSVEIYNSIENEEIKQIQLKNIAVFATAQLCLEKDLTEDIPKEAKELAQKEFALIREHNGFENSAIFPYELDYSQYIPRGHYTRSDDFKRYFKAMMWYGQAPFPLYIEEDKERNTEQTLQALLIAYTVHNDKVIYDKWENIYEPTNFFVGNSDDLGIYEYGELLFRVYGKDSDLNKLNDPKKLDSIYKLAEKLPEPKIKSKYTSVTTPVGKQFRFMGQRYVLDAEIIQELVEPITRPVPSGLDVMGVLGSKRAEQIQMEKEKVQSQNGYPIWDEYPLKFKEYKEKFSKITEEEWKSNMYQGWIWTLKGYLEPFKEGYPSFMTNEAWEDKDLNTALGSWSELKHDTILYGKQSGAEMGGWDMVAKGYVEPNIEVYEKLLWLTNFSRENLKVRDLSVESIDEKMVKFEELLEFLINCSVKQLRNEVLTEDEYYRIGYYGGTIEELSASFAGEGLRWFEITSETDKNMAVIADFHTIAPNELSPGGYMEAGVGSAYEIYVVVPIGEELYLTRGAVFSYHEFISTERLTDETWQQLIKEDKNPPMPEWTDSFIRGGKGGIPNPYNP